MANSFDPEDTRDIGYEILNIKYIDNSTIDESEVVVHLWNTQDDYYFNKSSGIQFTNHFEEYWTHNIFCGGYKSGANWVYKCNDALPFTWSLDTDNETYVNYTGWRDVTISEKIVRFAIRYHLKTNDENLTVQVSMKNIGGSDINTDLGFAWRVNNIKIKNDSINDKITIDGTSYLLNETLDLSFTNLSNSNYILSDGEPFDEDGKSFVRLDWDNNSNYKLIVKDQIGQYNSPVILGINMGSLLIGEQKITTFYWKDPTQNEFFYDGTSLTGWTVVDGSSTGWIVGSGGDSGVIIAKNTDGETTMTHDDIDFSSQTILWANVSYYWETNGHDSGEYFRVRVRNSTSGWIQVQDETFGGSASGTKYINFSDYIILDDNVSVQFACDVSANNENCQLDNINITTERDLFPQWSDNSTNDTFAGNQIEHRVYWTDESLSGFIFSFDNGTGSFTNDTFVSMTGINNWSNVTKGVNTTSGSLIRWRVYANDSIGSWNNTDTFQYNLNGYGILGVSIEAPSNNDEFFQYDVNLTINSTITCIGNAFDVCGTVSASARYNLSANPNTIINITNGATPFYIYSKEEVIMELRDPDTENLGDTHTHQQSPSTPQFATASLTLFNYSSWNGRGYFKFNISSIPDNVIIINASFNLFRWGSSDAGDNQKYITLYEVFGEHNVSEITWNNAPCGQFTMNASCNTTAIGNSSNIFTDGIWYNWSISEFINRSYLNSKQNVTFTAYPWGNNVNPSVVRFTSKENNTIGFENHPHINITYLISTNPKTSSETLESGESFTFNWTLNVTTASTINYLIDVNFSSSYGNSLVPDNSTDDRMVILNSAGVDSDPPQWFDNSINSTIAGTLIKHILRWTDESLSGFIFEFDNGNGTFYNDSFVSMSGAEDWSNVTKVVNSTESSTIRWRVYANDSLDQWNSTDTFTYDTTSASSCSCVGLNNNWEINMADSCVINSDCDLGTGNITWVGTGNATFNATISCKDMNDPPASSTLFIDLNTKMIIG